MEKRTLILSLWGLFFSLLSFAQAGRFYDTNDGLSSTFINQIYQDSKGYIWIATEYGLNKFDGVNFTNYRHDVDDSTSLRNNYVRCMLEDDKGNLFLGFYNGMMRYDRAVDAFVEIPIYRDGRKQNPHVTCISQLHNGEIWIVTAGQGLFKYHPHTNEAHSMVEVMEVLQIYFLNNMIENSDGSIWIGSEFNGLIYFHPKTLDVKMYRYPLLPDNSVTALVKTATDELLIGTQKQGVVRFDAINNRFVRVPVSDATNSFSVFTFGKIEGEVWVGCDGEGIKIYDTDRKVLETYQPDIATLDYNQSRVHALIEDKDKNVWIGFCQKGVAFINHKKMRFDYMGRLSSYYNPIGYNCVRAMYEDKKGHLWVSNDNEGLYELDNSGKRVRHLLPEDEGGTIPKVIHVLFEDSQQRLWIGAPTHRVGVLDKQKGRLQQVDGIEVNKVTSIAEDKEGNLYFATFGSGLYCYNNRTGQMKRYIAHQGDELDKQKTSLANAWINEIKIDRDGLLWIAHYKGVSCFNPVTESFVDLGSNILIGNCIGYVLLEDEVGDIWAGTGEGLYRFNKQSRQSQRFTLKNGLPNNVICGICQDDNGSIWVSTYRGISCVMPQQENIVSYYAKDGLQGNEFFQGAYLRNSDGKIHFGGVNGITSFYPSEIDDDNQRTSVYITNFSIQQQSVNTQTLSGKKQVVEVPVDEAERFTLDYRDNTFTITFATLTFDNTNQLVYAYRIKELYTTWLKTNPGQNEVTYNNLPPGEYTFEVCVANQGSEAPVRSISIAIMPPWYLSWWAYAIYSLLVLLLLVGVINYIRMRMNHRRELMERKHAAEMNDAKLQFFINISHEIRTPMTLIMAPIEKLLKLDASREVYKSYQLIYRNAQRILSLINQLMDIHKVDKGQMSIHFEETDLVSFVQEVMQSFEYTAQKHNISFLLSHQQPAMNVWIDCEHFDKILLNILSNAFKYTPDGGIVEIYITEGMDANSTNALKEYVEIAVVDNGIGIDPDKIERIFECFYRIDNQTTHQNVGTGIGLYLTQLLVKLHQGHISAQNREGESGSKFIIRIPKGRSHLCESECLLNINNRSYKHLHDELAMLDALIKNNRTMKTKAKTNVRILIAEDEEEICDYLRQELSEEYKVTICHDGKEAYEQVLTGKIDLIVSDVMMPEMSGTELCQKVKGNMNFNHLPIILLTAKSGVEERVEGIEKGADAYIVKPFSMEVLKSTIANLIQSRHLLKTRYSGAQEQKEHIQRIDLKSADEQLMERIMQVINENIANPELNAELLASQVGLSRGHVHRKMKELTNLSARDFIKNVRLRQAAVLLQEKKLGVSDVAYATGFSTLSYFSALFKEAYGVTPKEYRNTFRVSTGFQDPY